MADGINSASAVAFVSAAVTGKPELMIYADMTVTARAGAAALAAAGETFERGGRLVQVVARPGEAPTIRVLAVDTTTNAVHRIVQPVRPAGRKTDGGPTTLPERVAKLILAEAGDGRFQTLDGMTTAPLLTEDGGILQHDGYHPPTRMWCANVPRLAVPDRPTDDQARTALLIIRRRFHTFPFADSERVQEGGTGVSLVDIDKPPGADESGFLTALLTAAARPSLPLAPGFKVSAPAVSGSGAGKGLLARSICAIAFGTSPAVFTAGPDRAELDKRLGAALMEAGTAIMLDNANGMALRSDTLASALTERPALVRVLGRSELVQLNPTAFILVTGNGLSLAEDLARRFVVCDLDAKTEDPEARPFDPGFLTGILAARNELLAAALTVWRWGRQSRASLKRGRPLGSYETWAEWVRDPLLTLGCRDPADRVAEAKANDPMRRRIADMFNAWSNHHGPYPVSVASLHDEVRALADPQGRGRQYVASYLAKLAGTRAAGFVMTAQAPAGHTGATTYALQQTEVVL
jgi:hypothetical protein